MNAPQGHPKDRMGLAACLGGRHLVIPTPVQSDSKVQKCRVSKGQFAKSSAGLSAKALGRKSLLGKHQAEGPFWKSTQLKVPAAASSAGESWCNTCACPKLLVLHRAKAFAPHLQPVTAQPTPRPTLVAT